LRLLVQTARLYAQHYKWFPMPASVHKVLVHGSLIISAALLPIGMFSDESQECRNKDVRNFREHRCRKMSRVVTNTDLLHILLTSSDPVISSLRPSTRPKVNQEITKEMFSLLKKDCCDLDESDWSCLSEEES